MNETEIITQLGNLKHRIFPRPFERLAVKGEGLVGVEIGVFKGAHAQSLLENLPVKRLYLIDPYELYAEYTEGRSYHDGNAASLKNALDEARDRLKSYSDRVSWIFKQSSDALVDISEELDFVYIDGNHQEEFVSLDILGSYEKVRQGGVIGGHDFYNGYCRDHDGVVRAVTRFAVENNLPLQVELPDWWIQKPLASQRGQEPAK